MKSTLRDYIILLSGAGLILFLDQYTKTLVRTHLAIGQQWAPWDWLLPYARIVHWTNRGAAFGIFQNGSLFFTLLAFVVALLILVYYPHIPHHEWGLRTALMLQLGGATGNLADRLIQGHVTDFISVGNFAVFNVADASIFIGAVILVFTYWWQESHNSQVEEPQEFAPPQVDAQPHEDAQP